MCNCNKSKKVAAEEVPPTATKSRKMESANLPPEMMKRVNVGLRVAGPVRLPVEMLDGTRREIKLRQNQEIERYLKVRAMQSIPHLFYPDDPDWQYAGDDERASDLFQKVNAHVE
jgi:hypothetical protein